MDRPKILVLRVPKRGRRPRVGRLTLRQPKPKTASPEPKRGG